jgi:uncharacterized protein YacL
LQLIRGEVEVLNQATKLRGSIRKTETRREVQRMFGIIQGLLVASMNTLPSDDGATTMRFPTAEIAKNEIARCQ